MTVSPSIATEPLEKQTWQYQGHNIKYVVQGTGQPLILIHGFGASIGHWRKNISVLAASGYKVFAIDLLGFGGSDKPPLDYTLELWLDMLRQVWGEKINEPATFIGNSIGALLALMAVAESPEMASRGVLINSAGGLNHRPEELNLPLRVIMGTFARVIKSDFFGPFLFDRIRQKPRIRGTLRQVYRNREAITEELVEMLYAPACDPGAQKVFASVITAPPGKSPAQLLPLVERPLLVLWGERDPWTPISGAQIYREFQQAGKQIEIIPIPNAGHCPHDEYPDLVNDRILQWLAHT